MSRIAKKYIKYGTGSDESNGRDIPANLTPSNYTPAQVASEGNDKISAHLNGIDTALGSAGSAFFDVQDVSSNITIASGKTYLVDTTVARTLTLPSSPSTNDYFVVKDKSGSANTNNITIARGNCYVT